MCHKTQSSHFSKVPGKGLVIIVPNKPHFLLFRFSNMERKGGKGFSNERSVFCPGGSRSQGWRASPPSNITVSEAAATTMGGMFTLLPFMVWGSEEPVVEFLKISKQ